MLEFILNLSLFFSTFSLLFGEYKWVCGRQLENVFKTTVLRQQRFVHFRCIFYADSLDLHGNGWKLVISIDTNYGRPQNTSTQRETEAWEEHQTELKKWLDYVIIKLYLCLYSCYFKWFKFLENYLQQQKNPFYFK